MEVLIGLMFLSVVSADHPMASVKGSVSVALAGHPLDCIGVLLIPRSPEIDAAVREKFGKLDEGTQATSNPSMTYANYDQPVGSRQARCGGRFSEKFEFSHVPPGEYFLTMTALPGRPFAKHKMRPKVVDMMRRVLVPTAGVVKVNFKYND